MSAASREAFLNASTIATSVKRRTEERNRVQVPRSELENRVLAAFERKSEYMFTELDRICDQPTKVLKDILNEMCTFVTARRVWQLKAQYRLRGADDDDDDNDVANAASKAIDVAFKADGE